LLKVKPSRDSEATVVGYTWGKGKLEGLMGSMLVDWEGIQFELSGFTNEERVIHCKHYEADIRETVSFKYRELTDDGKPKEARYWRER
jgi:DNA ligase-1